jgi:hypothetical protein
LDDENALWPSVKVMKSEDVRGARMSHRYDMIWGGGGMLVMVVVVCVCVVVVVGVNGVTFQTDLHEL